MVGYWACFYPVLILLAALLLPDALGLWYEHFFTAYPLTQGTIDPEFVMPVSVIVAQITLLIL